MRPPLVLTQGDPSGIGPEITLAAWERLCERSQPFFVVGDPVLYGARAAIIDDASEAAAAFSKNLPVLPRPLVEPAKPGAASVANAGCVLASIDEAIDAVREGRAAAIVTNPISKAILHRAGFDLPGHTEYLAQRLSSEDAEATLDGTTPPGDGELPPEGQAPPRGPVMMLVGGGVRVALATIHIPLRAVPDALTTDGIVNTARVAAAALEHDFGVDAPAIALCGLNPHAGESGDIGAEEIEIINPAAKLLRDVHGLNVTDALAADGLFAQHERARYDAIIAMYHDQGLAPVKALDFDNAVNVTLGLDVVRTSPDHGVAFGIAGQGLARPDSLIAAIELAAEIAARRESAVGRRGEH